MELKRNEYGLWEVECDAEDSVLGLSPGERVLGSMMNAQVSNEPRSKAEKDLIADTFFGLWQYEPFLIENPTPQRAVNSAILDWFMNTDEFHQTRSDTKGNLFGSALSAGVMWEFLVKSDEMRKALDKQQEAEESAEKQKEIINQMSDGLSKEQMQALIDALREEQAKGEQAAAEATEIIEDMKDDAMQSGMVAHIAEQAGEATREANALVRGWGTEPDQISPKDAQEVMQLVKRTDTRDLSELLGRLRGVSMDAIDAAYTNNTSVNVEAAMTNRFHRLFPTSRVYMSDNAPPYIQATKRLQMVSGGGLLGWREKTEAKRQGAFVAMVDKSGSMYGGRLTAAQAIVMSIASALKQDDTIVERDYSLCYFDTQANIESVLSEDDWRAHVAWASVDAGGGTSFDVAFKRAMKELEGMKARGIDGADLLFITDGECWLSDEMRKEWQDFSDEVGTRLIVVQVSEHSGYGGEELFDMADVHLKISHDDITNNPDEIVRQITTEIVKGDIASL